MSKLESIVKEFVGRLEDEMRGQLAEEVQAAIETALGSVGAPGIGGRRAIRLGRRTPEQLAATRERLLKHIKAKPGQRSELIARDLGISTKEMVLPLRELLEKGYIKAKGVARGTTYA